MSLSRKLTLGLTGALLAGGGLGAGLALAASNPAPDAVVPAALTGSATTPPSWMSGYAGYSGMMNRYGGPGPASTASGWPGGMMGHWTGTGMMGGGGGYGAYSGTGMGTIMGRVLAGVPGPRVSTTEAAAAATAVPNGAVVDAARNRLTFTGATVTLTIVAGADEKSMYAFEAAGLTNPQIEVPAGAQVTLRLINADADMAHGIVVTATSAAHTSWMPMMTTATAFPGAAIWALGETGPTGAATATTSFTASAPGSYTYLCPVPGHTQQGMYGTLIVR